MKKVLAMLMTIILISMFLTSCAVGARVTDKAKYRTITGKKGTVELMVGIDLRIFNNVKVTYSSSDTMAVMFTDNNNDYYYQDGLLFTY